MRPTASATNRDAASTAARPGPSRRGPSVCQVVVYVAIMTLVVECLLQVVGMTTGLFPQTSILNLGRSASFRSHDFLITVPKADIDASYTRDGRLTRIKRNNFGMRGPDITLTKPPDVVRIVTMGGSTTYCWNASDGSTWSDVMAQQLRDRFPDLELEVLNAGVSGFTSFSNLVYLAGRVSSLEPDLIVLYNTANDLVRLQKSSFDGDYDGFTMVERVDSQLGIKYFLYKTFMLARVAYEVKQVARRSTRSRGFAAAGSTDSSFRDEVLRRSRYFRRNLENIVSIARTSRIGVVLSTQASPYPHLDSDPTLWPRIVAQGQRPFENLRPEEIPAVFAHYSDEVMDVCRLDPSVTCVDTAGAVAQRIRSGGARALAGPDGDGVFIDWIHCTPGGYQMVGESIAEAVADALRARSIASAPAAGHARIEGLGPEAHTTS